MSFVTWFLNWREARRIARQEADALWPGTRIRLVNRGCCVLSRKQPNGTLGTIKRFVRDGHTPGYGDYAVCLDGCKDDPTEKFASCGYLCEDGFEVLAPGEEGFRR